MSGRVTVMVPSYNYSQYLRECVESAVNQTGVDVDVAVVDNASTDGSWKLGEQLAAQYPQVRLVRYEDNHGIICSFNRCRDEVRGEFAVLLCADDCLTPGSLARSVAFMDAHPNVGMVYGRAIDFLDLDEVTADRLRGTGRPPIVYPGAAWVERRCREGTNPIRTPEVLMRTSTLDVVGKLDPACPHTSDLNMWLRIAAHTDIAYLPDHPQALYRRHAEAHSKSFLGVAILDMEQRWVAYSRFFEGLDGHPKRPEWERLARRTLASEARYAATRAYVTDAAPDDVDRLLTLAVTLDPDGVTMLEEWSWKIRRRLGPMWSRRFPPFLPRGALRRMGRNRAERRRIRTGL